MLPYGNTRQPTETKRYTTKTHKTPPPNPTEQQKREWNRLNRGSRKHVLDWIAQDTFLADLRARLPAGVTVSDDAWHMPRKGQTDEAQLRGPTPDHLPANLWKQLADWWLVHASGATLPVWDLAVAADIDGRPGFVLVEAKANSPELGRGGKRLPEGSNASKANHKRISDAIAEANRAWSTQVSGLALSADAHYQLANRLAWVWKLADLGVPVVFAYLGFYGDDADVLTGAFQGEADWRNAFTAYAKEVGADRLFDRRYEFGHTPVHVLLWSKKVIESSRPILR